VLIYIADWLLCGRTIVGYELILFISADENITCTRTLGTKKPAHREEIGN